MLQEEALREAVHQEEVPREGGYTPKLTEEEGEAKDIQRIEERIAEVTQEGGMSSMTQTGANMMPPIGRDLQDLVEPRDQQATRGEIER